MGTPHVLSITILTLCSLYWGSYAVYDPEKIAQTFSAIEQMYVDGKLRPVVYGVVSLENLKLGLQEIASRKTYGKLIVSIANEEAKL